VSFELLFRILL